MGIEIAHSISGTRVARALDHAAERRGLPRVIVVDNGTEFTANVFDAGAYEQGIDVHFITPGKPVENAVIESFNGKLREECLNASWFETLDQARETIESWRTDYNQVRPHSSLGDVPTRWRNLTPSRQLNHRYPLPP